MSKGLKNRCCGECNFFSSVMILVEDQGLGKCVLTGKIKNEGQYCNEYFMPKEGDVICLSMETEKQK